jgi:hypothetical protein
LNITTGTSLINRINTWTVLKFLFRWSGKLLWYSLVIAGYIALVVLDLICAMLAGLTYMSIQADRANRAHHRNSFHRARGR